VVVEDVVVVVLDVVEDVVVLPVSEDSQLDKSILVLDDDDEVDVVDVVVVVVSSLLAKISLISSTEASIGISENKLSSNFRRPPAGKVDDGLSFDDVAFQATEDEKAKRKMDDAAMAL
jgi:hypothetical protein